MSRIEVPPGWELRPGKAFNTHIGPFYQREDGDALRCGFITDERHGNKRGVTHGGMVASAFDVALGNASWDAAGEKPCATVQLNIHYAGALPLHSFAEIAVEVVRANLEPGVPAGADVGGRAAGRDGGRGMEDPGLAGRSVHVSVSFSSVVPRRGTGVRALDTSRELSTRFCGPIRELD